MVRDDDNKYNLIISQFVYNVLERDCINFGGKESTLAAKRNKNSLMYDCAGSVNGDKSFNFKSLNDFCNAVVAAFYDVYETGRKDQIKRISEIIECKLRDKSETNSIASEVVNDKRLYEMVDDKLLSEKTVKLNFKVTNKASSTIDKIRNSIDEQQELLGDGLKDSEYNRRFKKEIEEQARNINGDINEYSRGINDYLRRIFTYYASMSACKREMILFSERCDKIQEAINNNGTLFFDNIKFKPFAIVQDANEQHSFVIGVKDDEKQTYGVRYTLFTMKLYKFNLFRLRSCNKDMEFDKDYIIEKYKDKVDDEFEEILDKLNMIIDLAHKYNFEYDEEIDSYVMDLSGMKKREVIYYEDKYGYDNEEEIIIPRSFMDTELSIPVKLQMMMKHNPNFAYRIDDDVLVKVKYTAEGADEYKRVYINRPEVVRFQNDNEVVFETTTMQASLYFRRLKGFKILEPKWLEEEIMNWHKSVLLESDD